jgi:hypothetical protein
MDNVIHFTEVGGYVTFFAEIRACITGWRIDSSHCHLRLLSSGAALNYYQWYIFMYNTHIINHTPYLLMYIIVINDYYILTYLYRLLCVTLHAFSGVSPFACKINISETSRVFMKCTCYVLYIICIELIDFKQIKIINNTHMNSAPSKSLSKLLRCLVAHRFLSAATVATDGHQPLSWHVSTLF